MRSALRSASITASPAAPSTSATGTLNSSTRFCEGWISGADFSPSPPPLRIRRDRQQRPLCDRGRQRRLLAHLQRRDRELFDDQQQPRRTEIAQRGFNIALPRKVQPRKAAVQQGRQRGSLGNRERRFVQPGRLALGGGDDYS